MSFVATIQVFLKQHESISSSDQPLSWCRSFLSRGYYVYSFKLTGGFYEI